MNNNRKSIQASNSNPNPDLPAFMPLLRPLSIIIFHSFLLIFGPFLVPLMAPLADDKMVDGSDVHVVNGADCATEENSHLNGNENQHWRRKSLATFCRRLINSAGVLFQNSTQKRILSPLQIELLFHTDLSQKNALCGKLNLAVFHGESRQNYFFGQLSPFCVDQFLQLLSSSGPTNPNETKQIELKDKHSFRVAQFSPLTPLKMSKGDDGKAVFSLKIEISKLFATPRKIPLEFKLDLPSHSPHLSHSHSSLRIATYNVERMNDVHDDGSSPQYSHSRSNWSRPPEDGNGLPLYQIKARRIAHVLVVMGGPDLVALQEIENDGVFKKVLWPELEKIGYVDYHLADQRPAGPGLKFPMTTAIISKIPIDHGNSGHLPLRNLKQALSIRNPHYVQINLSPFGRFIVYNSHWASKISLENLEESDADRLLMAKTIRKHIDDKLREHAYTDIILLGDMNSTYNQTYIDRNSFNRPDLVTGIVEGLGSTGDERLMVLPSPPADGQVSRLYNLWYELAQNQRYNYFYQSGSLSLDHILVTHGLYDHSALQYIDNSFRVVGGGGGIAREILVNGDGRPLRWQVQRNRSGTSTSGLFPYMHLGLGHSDHLPLMAEFHVLRPPFNFRKVDIHPSSTQDERNTIVNSHLPDPCRKFAPLPLSTQSQMFFEESNLGRCFRIKGRFPLYREKGTYERWIYLNGQRINLEVHAPHPSSGALPKELELTLAPAGEVNLAMGKWGWDKGMPTLYIFDSGHLSLSTPTSSSSAPSLCREGETYIESDFIDGPTEGLDLRCVQWAGTIRITSGELLSLKKLIELKAEVVSPIGRFVNRLILHLGEKDFLRLLSSEHNSNTNEQLTFKERMDKIKGKAFSLVIKAILEDLGQGRVRLNTKFMFHDTGNIVSIAPNHPL